MHLFHVAQKWSILHKRICKSATKSFIGFFLRANFIKLFCNVFTQSFCKLSHCVIVHLFHAAHKRSILHKLLHYSVTKSSTGLSIGENIIQLILKMFTHCFGKLGHFILVHYFPVAQKWSILHKLVCKSVIKKFY